MPNVSSFATSDVVFYSKIFLEELSEKHRHPWILKAFRSGIFIFSYKYIVFWSYISQRSNCHLKTELLQDVLYITTWKMRKCRRNVHHGTYAVVFEAYACSCTKTRLPHISRAHVIWKQPTLCQTLINLERNCDTHCSYRTVCELHIALVFASRFALFDLFSNCIEIRAKKSTTTQYFLYLKYATNELRLQTRIR